MIQPEKRPTQATFPPRALREGEEPEPGRVYLVPGNTPRSKFGEKIRREAARRRAAEAAVTDSIETTSD